ncbi:MAG: NUDIX domain-containing protein [Desulfurellales bacterium]|nr:MAG: NUDIX domain-containing protein [Desulfurellales bacterium]
MKRYSCIVAFSSNLHDVLLIHKLRPAWQAGKANFPGGKVDAGDWLDADGAQTTDAHLAHLNCAVRELREETGLKLNPNDIKDFCTLHFTTNGEPGECWFYCTEADIASAKTQEEERIFVAPVSLVLQGEVTYATTVRHPGVTSTTTHTLPTMPNLPWLCAAARQCLRGEDVQAWPLLVVEGGQQRLPAIVIAPETVKHALSCNLQRAVGPCAVECEHGYDVCPKCDPCTCGAAK